LVGLFNPPAVVTLDFANPLTLGAAFEAGWAFVDPTAVVGLFNPKLGFLISLLPRLPTDAFEFNFFDSDIPMRDVLAPLLGSAFVALVEPKED